MRFGIYNIRFKLGFGGVSFIGLQPDLSGVLAISVGGYLIAIDGRIVAVEAPE
jgi:hypothetical protein